jgi:hypothetical protein
VRQGKQGVWGSLYLPFVPSCGSTQPQTDTAPLSLPSTCLQAVLPRGATAPGVRMALPHPVPHPSPDSTQPLTTNHSHAPSPFSPHPPIACRLSQGQLPRPHGHLRPCLLQPLHAFCMQRNDVHIVTLSQVYPLPHPLHLSTDCPKGSYCQGGTYDPASSSPMPPHCSQCNERNPGPSYPHTQRGHQLLPCPFSPHPTHCCFCCLQTVPRAATARGVPTTLPHPAPVLCRVLTT